MSAIDAVQVLGRVPELDHGRVDIATPAGTVAVVWFEHATGGEIAVFLLDASGDVLHEIEAQGEA